jgi:transcriptional regulator with XRE-family HTH domain
MSDIVKQLRKIRRDQEISQDALAAAAGMAKGHISGLERGQRNPALTTLTNWAGALGYEIVLRPKE